MTTPASELSDPWHDPIRYAIELDKKYRQPDPAPAKEDA